MKSRENTSLLEDASSTLKSGPPKSVHKIVVFFDICSSTTLLEDLLRTENQKRWRNVLIGLKEFLVIQQEIVPYQIYKFLGDGWILLFNASDVSGEAILDLLKSICFEYTKLFKKYISEVIDDKSCPVGITFGMDQGQLIKVRMNQQNEYLGRALNVAARLQASIKQRDSNPEGKLLMSKSTYVALNLKQSAKYSSKLVERKLQNISGGKRYHARKIIIHQ